MNWSYLAIWIGLPGLAGYIAHKKGRSWITAALLTVLVPPVGIVIAFLQSPHPSTGQPTNTKAKLLIGLSPLWVAIIVLIAGSYVSPSPEYWTVAPWIVVVAIPACAVTLALLEVTARLKRAERKR
jgi:hypothetical protein